MISQVFQQGRLFCHWDRHYVAPPHCSLSSPHLLRRKKPENVSWLTAICSPAKTENRHKGRQIGLRLQASPQKCPFSQEKLLQLVFAAMRTSICARLLQVQKHAMKLI